VVARVAAPRHESSAWLKRTTSPRWNHECLKSFTSQSSSFGKVNNELSIGHCIYEFSMYITTRPVSHVFLLVHPQQFFSFFSFYYFIRLVRFHSFFGFHSLYKFPKLKPCAIHSNYKMSTTCIKKTCLLAFLLFNCEF
jgi:hypothetical protein